ncbi:MAG: carboxypeptidase regulatory-like domain-containing protein [Nanoarchaeota archaeon]
MKYLSLLAVLLLIPVAQAAILHGTVYDLSLEPAQKAIVSVDTIPKQQVAAIDGSYTLNIPKGDYTIQATQNGYSTTEKITIVDEREYTLDLFLFVDLSDDEGLTDDVIDIDEEYPYEDNKNYMWFSLLIIPILIVIAYIKFKPKIPPEVKEALTDDLEKVITIIKKHGGRTTQKAIRKELGLSEAKISLIIADLENQGKIRKFKKGRTNIIVMA